MNILAEEQKKLYEPNLSDSDYYEREEHFLELYYRLRKKQKIVFWESFL